VLNDNGGELVIITAALHKDNVGITLRTAIIFHIMGYQGIGFLKLSMQIG